MIWEFRTGNINVGQKKPEYLKKEVGLEMCFVLFCFLEGRGEEEQMERENLK